MKNLLLAVIIGIFLAGCDNGPSLESWYLAHDYLYLSTNSINFDNDGGTESLTVNTTGQFTVSLTNAVDWLVVSRLNNTISLKAASHTNNIPRSVDLIVTIVQEKQSKQTDLQQLVSITQTGDSFNGHQFVDLGLPSGTLWATCNIGANTLYEYGDYYAFGELSPKDEYTESNYSYTSMSEILELASVLCSEDAGYYILNNKYDVARQKWGGSWNMPNFWDFLEIKRYCTWQLVYSNNKPLFQVTGPSGKSVYFPLSGTRHNDESTDVGLRFAHYMNGALHTFESNNWQLFAFISDGEALPHRSPVIMGSAYIGAPVRPVFRPNPLVFPSSAILSKDTLELFVGETVQLEATVLPENATFKFGGVWSSTDTKIAKVDTAGIVTAISEGVTNVNYGEDETRGQFFQASCTVIVHKKK